MCVDFCFFQVVIYEETFEGVLGLSFSIRLTRPALVFNADAVLTSFSGELCLQTLKLIPRIFYLHLLIFFFSRQ